MRLCAISPIAFLESEAAFAQDTFVFVVWYSAQSVPDYRLKRYFSRLLIVKCGVPAIRRVCGALVGYVSTQGSQDRLLIGIIGFLRVKTDEIGPDLVNDTRHGVSDGGYKRQHTAGATGKVA